MRALTRNPLFPLRRPQVDKFMKALQEEADASKEFFGDKGLVTAGGGEAPPPKNAEQLIDEMHAKGSHINFVAFTLIL